MKAIAYGRPRDEDENADSLDLREFALVGTPDELRRIAAFILKSADEIEARGISFGHNHLQDEPDLKPWFGEGVDVIVARRDPSKD